MVRHQECGEGNNRYRPEMRRLKMFCGLGMLSEKGRAAEPNFCDTFFLQKTVLLERLYLLTPCFTADHG